MLAGKHAMDSPVKALWVFVPGKLLVGLRNPFKLSKVNVSHDEDILLTIKTSKQQGIIG